MNKLYMCSKNICKLMVWYSHLLAYIDLTKTLFKIYLPTIKLQNNYIVHKLQFSEFCYCLYVKKINKTNVFLKTNIQNLNIKYFQEHVDSDSEFNFFGNILDSDSESKIFPKDFRFRF